MNRIEIITPADALSLILGRAEDGGPGRVRIAVELPVVLLPTLLDALERLQPPAPTATLRPRAGQGRIAR